jgi:hypothetical protein
MLLVYLLLAPVVVFCLPASTMFLATTTSADSNACLVVLTRMCDSTPLLAYVAPSNAAEIEFALPQALAHQRTPRQVARRWMHAAARRRTGGASLVAVGGDGDRFERSRGRKNLSTG